MKPATRLSAESTEVMLAGVYPACISVARDADGAAVEVVVKARGTAGKSGGGIELILADLGIALSRLLQGRDAG